MFNRSWNDSLHYWDNNSSALQNNIFLINVKIAIPPSLHSQALCVKCLIQNIILT